MPEITCFIQLPEGDNTLTIMLDTAISFEEFDNEIKEQLESLYKLKVESLKYAYIDEEDDQISFASNDELKEAFSQALKQPNEYFVILIDEIQRKPEEQSQNPPSSQSPPVIPAPQPITEEKEKVEEKKDDGKSAKNNFEIEVDIEDVLNIKSFADILKLGTKIMKDCPIFEELENEFKKQKEEQKKQHQQHPQFPFVHAFGGAAPFPFFPFVVPDCKQRSPPPPPPRNDNNNHESNDNNNNNRNNHRHHHCGEQKSRSTIIHPAVCDNCNMQIVGIRYKCLQCADFDFCERCEAQNTQNALHNPQHIFAKIYKPRDILNIRSAAPAPSPSPSPSCKGGMRFAPFFVRKQEVERNAENNQNNNNNSKNESKSMENENHPRNRFQCRVGSLQQRVDSLEAQISEIKQLLINNNKKVNSEPQVNKEEEIVSAIVQNVEVDPPVVQEKSANPEAQQLNEEDEVSYRMLQDIGFDLSPSIVIENRGKIDALIEQLFANLQ